MERVSQAFGFHKVNEPPIKSSVNGGDGVNRILYGLGKVGKVIEGQSPRAWNERIINVINTNILPRLTKEQLAAVARHHKGIEIGARIVGVGISTAELYTMFLLAGLAKKNMNRIRMKHTYEKKLTSLIHADRWFQEIRGKFTGRPEQFTAMAGTLAFLVEALTNEHALRQHQPAKRRGGAPGAPPSDNNPEKPKPGLIGVLSRVHNTNHAEASLRDVYREAHRERMAYEASLRGRQMPSAADMDKDADALFHEWQATQFQGAEGLLNAAGVQNSRARRLFRKIQGLHESPHAASDYVPMKDIRIVVDPDGIQRAVQQGEVPHPDRDALQAMAEHGWRQSDYKTEQQKGRRIRSRIPASRFTHQG